MHAVLGRTMLVPRFYYLLSSQVHASLSGVVRGAS